MAILVKNENSVDNILKLIKGNALDEEVKAYFKNLDPPRPELHIQQVEFNKKKNKNFTRKFSQNLYTNSHAWICGCEVRNAFFCYICLIVNSSNADPAWVLRGVADLKHLSEKIKKHKESERHMHNRIEFAMLGKINIQTQLDHRYRINLKLHNENVRKNRYILNKLIDAIKFSDIFELAATTLENTGVGFRGSINFNLMAKIDSTLKKNLENNGSVTDLSENKTILQNELLDSIYAVSLKLIYKEIEQTDYVAVQVNEISDCAALSPQMIFIIRYVLNGQLYERFMGFVKLENYTTEGIAEAILNQLDKLNIINKLIAQSYDGAAMIQNKIKAIYGDANYIHCYAHELNLIIERVASKNIKQLRVFFSNLNGFSTFFSRSWKRTAMLDDVVNKKRLPRNSVPTKWNFETKCVVATVFIHKQDIITCLHQTIDDETIDQSTLRKAIGLENLLNDYEFNFWLDFFNKIMPSCEIEPEKMLNCVETFKSAIEHVKNSFDYNNYVYIKDEYNNEDKPIITKRPRYDNDDKNIIVAKEVCEIMSDNISQRFEFTDHLSAAILFQPNLFSKHQLIFPEEEFKITVKTFNIDEKLLKHELTVIYNRVDFANAPGTLILYQCLYENNLLDVFPESVKLLKIICTMPMITAENERCLSTLKRIKTFTRNAIMEDDKRLSALAMCSIEQRLLQDTPDFNALVIDHFAQQKERSIDLVFKNIN